MPESPLQILLCIGGLISIVVTITFLFMISIRGKLGYYADFVFYSEEIFDNLGKKVFEKTEIDGKTSEVHYVFDNYGNVAAERHKNGFTLSKSYNNERGNPLFGKLIRTKDSEGIEILYEYDAHGNMTRCFKPNYDKAGAPIICEENTYNEKNQKIEARVFGNEVTHKFTYDESGFLVKEVETYKDNYDLCSIYYENDSKGRTLRVKGYIESSAETKRLVRDEEIARNADGDIIYYKDFIHNIEYYRVYLISIDKNSGFTSKVCLQYKTKVY
jgi:YD repeat-containing protein